MELPWPWLRRNYDQPTLLGELRFERGVLVNGFDELFRVGLVGIVLRPG